MMSNGVCLARAGTAAVAMLAHAHHAPVIVLVLRRDGRLCVRHISRAQCETYKFYERVQLDSITNNELLDPNGLVRYRGWNCVDVTCAHLQLRHVPADHPLRQWRSMPNLALLSLRYDITPTTFIDAVGTEVGLLPCTSVPVVVREFRKEALQ
jgi:translation initiation factor eIF-2B subunit delta